MTLDRDTLTDSGDERLSEDTETVREQWIRKRFDAIRKGIVWKPDGWAGWHVRIIAGLYDSHTIVAEAVCEQGTFAGQTIEVAWRIMPEALGEALDDLLCEIRSCTDLPEKQRAMRELPLVAHVPQPLIDSIKDVLKPRFPPEDD